MKAERLPTSDGLAVAAALLITAGNFTRLDVFWSIYDQLIAEVARRQGEDAEDAKRTERAGLCRLPSYFTKTVEKAVS